MRNVVECIIVASRSSFKRFSVILNLLLLFSSCGNVQEEKIFVDLNDTADKINYSSFVDSVSYVTLHLEEDMYIGEIERLYKQGDYYYVWSTHRTGIYVFDASGKVHSHINSYGEGPEDFQMISSFSIVKTTGDVCIMDFPSQKLKFYAKQDGSFMNSSPCPYWSVDLAVFGTDSIVFISPFYLGEENPNGIWLAGKDNRPVRQLSDDVTSEHQLFYFPMTYHWGDTCIYYYDRNWDYLSSVSTKGMEVVHQFDVRQKIPASMIRDINMNLSRLNGYAICDRFVYSPSRLLVLYCRFEEDDKRSYVWAMFDKDGNLQGLANKLYNDLDSVSMENNILFYLDENTWARLCEEEADNFDVRIQLLHLSE